MMYVTSSVQPETEYWQRKNFASCQLNGGSFRINVNPLDWHNPSRRVQLSNIRVARDLKLVIYLVLAGVSSAFTAFFGRLNGFVGYLRWLNILGL